MTCNERLASELDTGTTFVTHPSADVLPPLRHVASSDCEAASNPCYRIVGAHNIGYAIAELPHDQFAQFVDTPEDLIRASRHEPIKDHASTLLVCTELPLAHRTVIVACKRMRRQSRFKAALDLLRPHRALRAWTLGRLLLARGIPTARPLAVVVPKRVRFHQPAYLITEWTSGAVNLKTYFQRLATRPPEERRVLLKQTARALGQLIGRLHAENFSHRDLKATNILVDDRRQQIEVSVIDLDGVSVKRRISTDRRLRDIKRIAASIAAHPGIGQTTRLRFLQSYLDTLRKPSPPWKETWQRLIPLTRAKLSRSVVRSRDGL